MLNWLLSLMVHKDLLTEEEAQFLSKKLAQSMQPQEFDHAHKIVSDLLKELKDTK